MYVKNWFRYSFGHCTTILFLYTTYFCILKLATHSHTSFCFVLLSCKTHVVIYFSFIFLYKFFFIYFSLHLLFVIYTYISDIVLRFTVLPLLSLSLSALSPFTSFFFHFSCFSFQPLFPRARGHTRAHAHACIRSRSLANDMACPTVINHLSSRYRRISCVVSMRLQGSPPFLPLLPSAPC